MTAPLKQVGDGRQCMRERSDEVEERKKGRRQREVGLIVVLWSLERLPLMQVNTLMRKDQEDYHVKSYTSQATSTLRKCKVV